MRIFYTKNGMKKTRRMDPLVRKAEHRVSGTKKAVMSLIISTPGLSESEIAQWLNLSKQSVHYHIRDLESRGDIKVLREGGHAKCYPGLVGDGSSGSNGSNGNALNSENGGGGVRGKVPSDDEFKPT